MDNKSEASKLLVNTINSGNAKLEQKSVEGLPKISEDIEFIKKNLSKVGGGPSVTRYTSSGLEAIDPELVEKIAQKGVANGYVPLDTNTKIPATYLPTIAIKEIFVVASEAAMLSLNAQQGDVCKRTDIAEVFQLRVNDPTVLDNWESITMTSNASVSSVNGETGDVLLTTGDLSEDTDKRYVTDAEKTVISNTSGTNTGDQDLSGYELLSNKENTIIDTDTNKYPTVNLLKIGLDAKPDSLDELSDVTLATPLVDQVLKYNGSAWVNGNETTVNGGAGVELYYVEAASDISGYSQLLKAPDTGGELDETVVANNNRVLINEYATPSTGIGGTKIDAGIWTFDIWAYVDVSLSGSSSIEVDMFKRTSGGTETLLFTVNSGGLMTALGTEPNVATTVQPEFTINATDRLVAKVYGKNTAVNNRTIHFFHGGTTHYSHINSPLVVRHNDLAGINEGDLKHITAAQLAALHGVNDANTTSNTYADGKVVQTITNGDTTHASSSDALFDALALKQATLVSGTNIKTVNGNSLLGSGDVTISGGAVNTIGVTTANGVSGSSSGGADPRLTIALGAITPTSISTSGDITGGRWNGMVMKLFGTSSMAFSGNNTPTGSAGGNSLFGTQSGLLISSGADNTFIGAYAGRTISTGLKNTAIGNSALYDNSTGSNNVALGYYAGKYETGSNSFYVDSRDRTNTAGDKAGAILYGVMSATPASQTLKTNSVFTATYGITGTRIVPRVSSTTSAASITPDISAYSSYYLTAQTVGLTFNAPTGTPVIGEVLTFDVYTAGAQTLTWNAAYIAPGSLTLPTTTIAGKWTCITARYNGTNWTVLTTG